MKRVMRICHAFIFLILISFISNAQIVTIPDLAFKTLLSTTNCVDTNNDTLADVDADLNNDGEIQVSEASLVLGLYISSNGEIVDITGIQAFNNATTVSIISFDSITAIDFGAMISIKNLKIIGNNTLNTITISGLTNLENFIIDTNPLTSLNLSGLTSLKSLTCYSSNLTALDFTGLINLETLNFSNSGIPNLNLTNLINLKTLDCHYSYLSTLNLSGLIHLETLICYNSNLNTLNVSGLTALKTIDCTNNYLTSMNLAGATSLISIDCSENHLSSLPLTGLTQLQVLTCRKNNLLTLNLTGLSQLQILNCEENNNNFSEVSQLTSLDVTGLTSLTTLLCKKNSIASLITTGATSLTSIDCTYNLLPTLAITNLPSLATLLCNNNQLNQLNLVNLTGLTFLNCELNQLITLDVSNLTNLKDVYCAQNNLTSLNINNLTNLETLACAYNQLANLDLSSATKLKFIGLTGNLFSTLDFSNLASNTTDDFVFYSLSNNPNLTYINAKNNLNPYSFSVVNCPNLLYVCANESIIPYIKTKILESGLINVEVNSYCSFIPVGTFNTITGTVSIDQNGDGCDANDFQFPGIKMTITNGLNTESTFTNTTGNYSFYTQAGSFLVTPTFENPYFTLSPIAAAINFPLANSATQTQNFCITPLGIHNDLEIVIIPKTAASPGTNSQYQIVYKNKGNQILSGTINFVFNDAVLNLFATSQTQDSQTINNLNWNYIDLLPFETRKIDLIFKINSPQENPPVNIDDILNFTATIDPISGDETIIDNTFTLNQTVVSSFDPNDKICLEGNIITPEKVGDYLHYIIHFQNSGTAAAQNVVVKDVIDTTKFDISSLQLTNASHPFETKVIGNKIEFIFENIQLPTEIDNEPASYGFVAFKIKTKSDLVVGNAVSNKADIYFDYNFPIVTDPAVTTVSVLGVKEFENKSVSVFPNPVSDVLNISSKGTITSIQVYDVQGRLTDTFLKDDEKATINLSDKTSGVYFVKIFTSNGLKVEKVMKK